MPLMTGTRIGPYEIQSPLGAGGMGEVYRARDTKLNRDVALKILPEAFALDPERLARFKREAQVLASLNHPNIGAIYGLEETTPLTPSRGSQPAILALVLELVEGPTLAERLAEVSSLKSQGSGLPLDEALPIARQIVEALDAAHERGIIHRDLKPSNIKITSRGDPTPARAAGARLERRLSAVDVDDGIVKVLDFGLAKLGANEAGVMSGADVGDASESPTLTSPAATRAGVILGTAAYMAPEQAKGRAVDKRADIWAFGCVLYEILAGRKAFEGEDVSETLAAVLRGEPDWTALPPAVPRRIVELLRRCVKKDPRGRLRDIGDARLEIEAALADPLIPSIGEPTEHRRTTIFTSATWGLSGLIVGVVAAGLVGWNLRTPAETPRRVTRFAIVPEVVSSGSAFQNIAISSDGTQIVYEVEAAGTVQLHLRRFDEIDGKPIPGTAGGNTPFFSPGGDQIGFYGSDERQLKRVPIAGGTPIAICGIEGDIAGASWGADGQILFAQVGAKPGLLRVSASGGTPEPIARPDPNKNEREYRYPYLLPGGGSVLFTILPQQGGADGAQLALRSLLTGQQKLMIEGGTDAAYLPTGHLVYGRDGTLMAVAFDPAKLEVTGPPVSIQDNVVMTGAGDVVFAVSADGTLVYLPGTADPGRTLVWVSRDGKSIEPIPSEALRYARYPRLSPDGRRLALTLGASFAGDIWVYDLHGEHQPLKLTFEGHDVLPIWAPDGKGIAFQSDKLGARNMFSIPADGSAVQAERLLASERWQTPLDWSPDHSVLLFDEIQSQTRTDLWVLPLSGERKPRPWLQTRFNEGDARFSPDGQWIAYVSDQTDRNEVWVRAYPGPGAPIRISPDGGLAPAWARDGRELYYQTGTRLMSARILETRSAFRFEPPRILFAGGFIPSSSFTPRTYDVGPDGRFLMIQSINAEAARPKFVLVQNWLEELKRLVPAK